MYHHHHDEWRVEEEDQQSNPVKPCLLEAPWEGNTPPRWRKSLEVDLKQLLSPLYERGEQHPQHPPTDTPQLEHDQQGRGQGKSPLKDFTSLRRRGSIYRRAINRLCDSHACIHIWMHSGWYHFLLWMRFRLTCSLNDDEELQFASTTLMWCLAASSHPASAWMGCNAPQNRDWGARRTCARLKTPTIRPQRPRGAGRLKPGLDLSGRGSSGELWEEGKEGLGAFL